MALLPTSPDRLERVQAALREELTDTGREPEVKNLGSVLSLLGDVLEYPVASGNFYRVPPTPYTAGLRLQSLMRDLRDLRRVKDPDVETLAEIEARQNEAVRWFKRLSRPLHPGLRILWALPWVNPFKSCSDFEISQLLVFFYSWTTRSRVQFMGTPPVGNGVP